MPKWAWWALGLAAVGLAAWYFWPKSSGAPVSQRDTTFTSIGTAVGGVLGGIGVAGGMKGI